MQETRATLLKQLPSIKVGDTVKLTDGYYYIESIIQTMTDGLITFSLSVKQISNTSEN